MKAFVTSNTTRGFVAPVAVSVAVPVPAPTPVATNESPTVLEWAPIRVKSVVPTTRIVYVVPEMKLPAATIGPTRPVEFVMTILKSEMTVATPVTS